MDISKGYFALQLQFAARVAQVGHLTVEDALLNYTNLYLAFIDRSFNPAHPIWQEYLEGLRQTDDQATWTHLFYQKLNNMTAAHPYGCFSYSYDMEMKLIRIHFTGPDLSGYERISKERLPARLLELKTMFADIQKHHTDAQRVRGGSWLYNIDAYKRLFPSLYIDTARVIEGEFQFMALWGQFLQRDGQLRVQQVNSFLACIARQETLEGLTNCFPYQALRPECPIGYFYDFYEHLPINSTTI